MSIPKRVLSEAQERRLNRLFCTGDLGGGKWETAEVLLNLGYIAENPRSRRIELTPLGKEYCHTYGTQMPI